MESSSKEIASADGRELEPVGAADEDRDGEQGDVDDCARVDGDVKMEVHEEENVVEREVEPIRATDEHHENKQGDVDEDARVHRDVKNDELEKK